MQFNGRRLLRLLLLLILSVSCSLQTDQVPNTQPAEPLEVTRISPQSPTEAEITESWQSLDLRFAHVLEVTYEVMDPTQVRFDVTLVHDDDGEAPQYADWWQVEDLNGTVLGKRLLTHSHGTQPFTRSAAMAIPNGIDIVIVRGHDMQHGFGGQIIQLDLTTGEQAIIREAP